MQPGGGCACGGRRDRRPRRPHGQRTTRCDAGAGAGLCRLLFQLTSQITMRQVIESDCACALDLSRVTARLHETESETVWPEHRRSSQGRLSRDISVLSDDAAPLMLLTQASVQSVRDLNEGFVDEPISGPQPPEQALSTQPSDAPTFGSQSIIQEPVAAPMAAMATAEPAEVAELDVPEMDTTRASEDWLNRACSAPHLQLQSAAVALRPGKNRIAVACTADIRCVCYTTSHIAHAPGSGVFTLREVALELRAVKFCLYDLPSFQCHVQETDAPLDVQPHNQRPIVVGVLQQIELSLFSPVDVKGVGFSVTYPVPLIGQDAGLAQESLDIFVGDLLANERRVVSLPVFGSRAAIDQHLDIVAAVSCMDADEHNAFLTSVSVPIMFDCCSAMCGSHVAAFSIHFKSRPALRSHRGDCCSQSTPALASRCPPCSTPASCT